MDGPHKERPQRREGQFGQTWTPVDREEWGLKDLANIRILQASTFLLFWYVLQARFMTDA